MKILIIVIGFAAGVLTYQYAKAQNKVVVCEPDRKGRLCCWDTDQYGPSRPFICD